MGLEDFSSLRWRATMSRHGVGAGSSGGGERRVSTRSDTILPRQVAIWTKLPYVPLTVGGETCIPSEVDIDKEPDENYIRIEGKPYENFTIVIWENTIYIPPLYKVKQLVDPIPSLFLPKIFQGAYPPNYWWEHCNCMVLF